MDKNGLSEVDRFKDTIGQINFGIFFFVFGKLEAATDHEGIGKIALFETDAGEINAAEIRIRERTIREIGNGKNTLSETTETKSTVFEAGEFKIEAVKLAADESEIVKIFAGYFTFGKISIFVNH